MLFHHLFWKAACPLFYLGFKVQLQVHTSLFPTQRGFHLLCPFPRDTWNCYPILFCTRITNPNDQMRFKKGYSSPYLFSGLRFKLVISRFQVPYFFRFTRDRIEIVLNKLKLRFLLNLMLFKDWVLRNTKYCKVLDKSTTVGSTISLPPYLDWVGSCFTYVFLPWSPTVS